ncbi:hypothetical protein MJ561_29105 [Klebsiella pneumoniae]|nr:hypothetical protein MJ561_29105 [Klebsiella pneumoniae]
MLEKALKDTQKELKKYQDWGKKKRPDLGLMVSTCGRSEARPGGDRRAETAQQPDAVLVKNQQPVTDGVQPTAR